MVPYAADRHAARAGRRGRAKLLLRSEDPAKQAAGSAHDKEAPVPLTMYTTTWCGFCKNLKRQLGKAGVEVNEVDIERDPEAAKFVESVNGGNQTVPTLLFADGSTLCNPSAAQVQKKLAALAAASAS
jgi:mycoredoxin